jgi:hypothetical protein
MPDYLCRVCGESGVLSYTAYQGDQPISCRHRTQTLGNIVGVTIEADSELGMDEPIGPIRCVGHISHGENCPGWWVGDAEYPNEPTARSHT